MNRKNLIFLIIIFLTSFLLRIIKVDQYPTLLWDEAALGYNAFSILNTGRDEYGQILPLIFKSFGDYKPGLYVYLTVPFVALLGLNPLSVRLPSILLGSLIPIIFYFLIKEISPKSKYLPYLTAILITFNPYNIHFSRGAWETNILTFELILASYFFFKYLNSKSAKFLLFSSLVFGFTLYTYQAGKMISLLLISTLFILNFKNILKTHLKNFSLFFIFPLIIFSLPIIFGLLFNQNANRLKVVSLSSYPRSESEVQTIINEAGYTDYQIFHNPIIYYIQSLSLRYFNHFSPKFLAFEGDWQSPRHSAPYIGVLLYPSLIFLVIGIFSTFALSSKKERKLSIFFLIWLIIAPIPAALTRDSVQSVRSMSFSLPLIYFASLGITETYKFFETKKIKFLNFLVGFLIFYSYFISFFYYSELYLNHLVKKSPNENLYGYKQAMDYLITNQNSYQNIIFTNFYGQPYIYYLFYSKYSPSKYQSQAFLTESISGDTGQINQIDNIRFDSPNFNSIKETPNTLSIFSYDEILRQGIDQTPDFSEFIPLSPINNISTFYAYQTN